MNYAPTPIGVGPTTIIKRKFQRTEFLSSDIGRGIPVQVGRSKDDLN